MLQYLKKMYVEPKSSCESFGKIYWNLQNKSDENFIMSHVLRTWRLAENCTNDK